MQYISHTTDRTGLIRAFPAPLFEDFHVFLIIYIYAVQQDTQSDLMSKFIQHLC